MPQPSVELMVGGTRIQLRRADVLSAVRDGPLGVVRQHAVEIEQQLYPVKEVFARATGIDVLDFNTTQARSALRRLGSRCGPSARLAIAAIPEPRGRHMDVQNPLLATILGTATTAPHRTGEAGRTEAVAPGRLKLLVDADQRRQETAHSDRERQAARRHLRTLCEDLDEVLGQVGEAVSRNHVEAVDPLLINTVGIAPERARRLRCGEPEQNAAAAHLAVQVLDEADVLHTLGLLEALDAELTAQRVATAPPRRHGWPAPCWQGSTPSPAWRPRAGPAPASVSACRPITRTVTAGRPPQKGALTEVKAPWGRPASKPAARRKS